MLDKDERMIREVFPSVAAFPGVARIGRLLVCSIFAAPLGWALMLPFYFLKVMPFFARRYTLTTKRVMIRRGLKPVPAEQVPLTEIDDVKVVTDDNSKFFRAADIELVSGGKVALRLRGVPDPESFRHAVINACRAWAPGRMKAAFVPAKAN
ncbi:MAG: hypothetical protein KatS3mg105_0118 [Gemmatales bacterium]|nr:MAG: hypothetical protein KatS3mg105_0118 [Gemmatales bacterium]